MPGLVGARAQVNTVQAWLVDVVGAPVVATLLADAVVDGILTCMEGSHPSFHEYAQYLGFQADSDDNYQWIVNEFMSERQQVEGYRHLYWHWCQHGKVLAMTFCA